MLKLRPNCELCNIDLPALATNAMICSYECTYCAGCVQNRLHNVCPTCGGGFCPRPIRPAREWHKGLGLKHHPASDERKNTKFEPAEIEQRVSRLKHLEPEQR